MKHSLHYRAFSLIELLAVITVIGILMAIAIPIVTNQPTSARISGDADTLQSQLAYARTLAVANGQATEIRFYRRPLPGLDGRDEVFRSYQILQYDEDNDYFVPDGRIQDLEGDNLILDDATYSSLAESSRIQSADPNAMATGNRAAHGLDYFAIHFNPDGSTSLGKGGGDLWFLTIADFRESENSSDDPAANFVTLQIDPHNGTLRR
ncbi:MAG: Verru_Chthon cassette protein D, partial [Verrucomicrobiales bacterium]